MGMSVRPMLVSVNRTTCPGLRSQKVRSRVTVALASGKDRVRRSRHARSLASEAFVTPEYLVVVGRGCPFWILMLPWSCAIEYVERQLSERSEKLT